MNRRTMLRGTVAAAVAVGFGSACSEPVPPASTDIVDPGTPAPSASPTPSMPAAPLTGLPASSEATAARPALAVPIRITSGSTPAGVAEADILFQEYAESGSLHIAAVFQSRDATKIGPVTEVRPTDVRTLGVLRPFVGYDGGPTGFVTQFTQAGLHGATPDRQPAAFRGDYTSTAGLYKLAPKGDLRPTPIFDYAAAGMPLAEQQVAPATELTVAVPGRSAQTWRYDDKSGSWRGTLGRTTVSAASVIVLSMPYRTLSVRKPTYRSLPSAKVFGEGTVRVVSGPATAPGRWRKPGQKMACNVLDLSGSQIHPLPGLAWVVYAPPTAKVTVR